jgi:hypothetical protein
MTTGEIAWQFNEAVSMLREAGREGLLPPSLRREIGDGLPAMQSALEALVAMSDKEFRNVGTHGPQDAPLESPEGEGMREDEL